MCFTFETKHDQAAMTAMAKALRKTVRKKRSRRSHILGWSMVVLLVILLLPGESGWVWEVRTVVNLVVLVALLAVLLFEDSLNGYAARFRLLAGTETGTTVFTEESYTFQCPVAKSEWKYDAVRQAVDTGAHFVLIFSTSHAQVYAKAGLQEGTPEAFAVFLADKIDKPVQKL